MKFNLSPKVGVFLTKKSIHCKYEVTSQFLKSRTANTFSIKIKTRNKIFSYES